MALTLKQRKFIAAFAGNATEAARAAGYKGNEQTLGQVGYENLRKPEIAAALAKRETKTVGGLVATREERQRFWTEGMKGEHPGVDQLRASELLGKSCGDFVEKHEHQHDVRISVVDPFAVPK